MAVGDRRTGPAAIEQRPGVRGGKPIIAGTGIRVLDVVQRQRMLGQDISEIVNSLPHLTGDQVQAALDYYIAHKAEIDRDIVDEEAIFKQLESEQRSI